MTTHGIMFKAEMIQAYLQGMKTQTRRARGLEKVNELPGAWEFITISLYGDKYKALFKSAKSGTITATLPYGYAGDTLWFKETWKMSEREEDGKDFIHYRADDAKVIPAWWAEEEWTRPDPVWVGRFDKWQSSMFMPAICSRFRNIEIIQVRVQRLLDITIEDALLEGIRIPYERGVVSQSPADEAYLEYWDLLNGKSMPAGKNPWVWVYEFKTHRAVEVI